MYAFLDVLHYQVVLDLLGILCTLTHTHTTHTHTHTHAHTHTHTHTHAHTHTHSLIRDSAPLINTIIIIGCILMLGSCYLLGVDTQTPQISGDDPSIIDDELSKDILTKRNERYKLVCMVGGRGREGGGREGRRRALWYSRLEMTPQLTMKICPKIYSPKRLKALKCKPSAQFD